MLQLIFDGWEVPLTAGRYDVARKYVHNLRETEAGTKVRELVRTGIKGLAVETEVNGADEATLETYADALSINVQVFSESDGGLIPWQAFISEYQSSLIKDAADAEKRLYKATFTLEDLENV